MVTGLAVFLAAAMQSAGEPANEPAGEPAGTAIYGPMQPAPPKPATKPKPEPCQSTQPEDVKPETKAIVVCAPKVEGYRIDPDVLEAQRAKKNRNKPRGREMLVDTSCATVGPMGCRGGAGIDIIQAAFVLAGMADKISKGESVGDMFVTDPHPSEYQLYLEAKRRREAKEAEQAAAARAKASARANGTSGSK